MYPFYFGPAAGFSTPDKDDIAEHRRHSIRRRRSLRRPARITGRILASNGGRRRPGFNVIARNIANPFADAVSAHLRSDSRPIYSPDSELAGVYMIAG